MANIKQKKDIDKIVKEKKLELNSLYGRKVMEIAEAKQTPKQIINIFGEDKQEAIILGKIDLADEDEKIKFYNECLNCEESISNHKGERFRIKYIYITKQEIKNDIDAITQRPKVINGKDTHSAPRMVFYTEDGRGLISFSAGIYYALKGLYSVMGTPPYTFDIIFQEIEKGKTRVFTIQVAKREK